MSSTNIDQELTDRGLIPPGHAGQAATRLMASPPAPAADPAYDAGQRDADQPLLRFVYAGGGSGGHRVRDREPDREPT